MRSILTGMSAGLVLATLFATSAAAESASPDKGVRACVASGHLCSNDGQCCSKSCAPVRTHKECQQFPSVSNVAVAADLFVLSSNAWGVCACGFTNASGVHARPLDDFSGVR